MIMDHITRPMHATSSRRALSFTPFSTRAARAFSLHTDRSLNCETFFLRLCLCTVSAQLCTVSLHSQHLIVLRRRSNAVTSRALEVALPCIYRRMPRFALLSFSLSRAIFVSLGVCCVFPLLLNDTMLR